jgi:hypothetical protein
MKISLPKSRFHLNASAQSCSIHKHGIKGGLTGAEPLTAGALKTQSPLRANSDKKVYVVIGSDGLPVKDNREYKKYEAHKPYQAAIKAYYGLLRSKKPVPSTPPSPEEIRFVIELVSKTLSVEDATVYASKLKSAMIEMPALINLRRIDDSKVKSYVCYYELIRNPNKHEISKGIVKVAKAEELSKYKEKRNLSDANPVQLISY